MCSLKLVIIITEKNGASANFLTNFKSLHCLVFSLHYFHKAIQLNSLDSSTLDKVSKQFVSLGKNCSFPTVYPISNGYSRLCLKGCTVFSIVLAFLVHCQYNIKKVVTLMNPETPLDFYLETNNNIYKSVLQLNSTYCEGWGRQRQKGGSIEILDFFFFTDKRINFTVLYYIPILFVLIPVTSLPVFLLLQEKVLLTSNLHLSCPSYSFRKNVKVVNFPKPFVSKALQLLCQDLNSNKETC